MRLHTTNEAYSLQPICRSAINNSFVDGPPMDLEPDDPGEAGLWMKNERKLRGLSAQSLADRINDLAAKSGDPTTVSQQVVSKFEKGDTKRKPPWVRYAARALHASGVEANNAPAVSDDDVEIQQWDIAYGMGGGTYLDLPVTGETHKFSRSWLRQFTHAPPNQIFMAAGTGDSMMPTLLDADIVVIDTSQREVRLADKIWAAAYGQTGIIKRLRPMPDGSVKILSDNPNVPPETAYDGELSVVGRVVAVVRKM